MALRRGSLRHLIQPERASQTADGAGQTRETWAAIGPPLRASITQVSGTEQIRAGQQEAIASHIIRCPWPGAGVDLTPRDRITAGSKRYNIVSVKDLDERHRELEILAQEKI